MFWIFIVMGVVTYPVVGFFLSLFLSVDVGNEFDMPVFCRGPSPSELVAFWLLIWPVILTFVGIFHIGRSVSEWVEKIHKRWAAEQDD